MRDKNCQWNKTVRSAKGMESEGETQTHAQQTSELKRERMKIEIELFALKTNNFIEHRTLLLYARFLFIYAAYSFYRLIDVLCAISTFSSSSSFSTSFEIFNRWNSFHFAIDAKNRTLLLLSLFYCRRCCSYYDQLVVDADAVFVIHFFCFFIFVIKQYVVIHQHPHYVCSVRHIVFGSSFSVHWIQRRPQKQNCRYVFEMKFWVCVR